MLVCAFALAFVLGAVVMASAEPAGSPKDEPVAVESSFERSGDRAPVARNVSVATNEDVARRITLRAFDPDGDRITYALLRRPAHGRLTGTGKYRLYTPNTPPPW